MAARRAKLGRRNDDIVVNLLADVAILRLDDFTKFRSPSTSLLLEPDGGIRFGEVKIFSRRSLRIPVLLSLDWSRWIFSALRWRTRAFTNRRGRSRPGSKSRPPP